MSFTESKRQKIKDHILRKIDADKKEFIALISNEYGISVTSVKRYIESEIENAHIIRDTYRTCGYSLAFTGRELRYDIKSIAEREDSILFSEILPLINAGDKAMEIWNYVLPEILSNAVNHSGGSTVSIYVRSNYLYTRVTVADNGVGIFSKVREAMKSFGHRDPSIDDAVAELYKGKFTSEPDKYVGDGIFYSMHLLDKFAAISEGNVIRAGFEEEPSYLRSHLLGYAMRPTDNGTVIVMQLENDTQRDASDVFDKYSSGEDGLLRTNIPVFEACADRNPITRSQAKRLCARLDMFDEVILDFEKSMIMGQGFADEVFRVFHNNHPQVVVMPVGMNPVVKRMYLHAANNKVRIPDYSNAM